MHFSKPEHELLVLLSQKTNDQLVARRIDELSSAELRWSKLFSLAFSHGIFPLVYSNWRNRVTGKFTESEAQQWEQIYNNIKNRNLVLTIELMDILHRFQIANVSAIPLKGPVLSYLIYGDITSRLFSDLDILIPEDQFPRAIEILVEKGYHYQGINLIIKCEIQQTIHHLSLTGKNSFFVELHWSLDSPYFSAKGSTKAFWRTAKTNSILNNFIILPKDEEMLLFLCRHGSRHRWQNLKWLCDVASFIDKYEGLDWSYVLGRAESSHTKRMVLHGLDEKIMWLYLRENQEEEDLKSPTKVVILSDYEQMLAMPDSYDTSIAENYIKEKAQLILLHEDAFSRVRYIYSFLIRPHLQVTQKDMAYIDFPEKLSFLYLLFRPIRLIVTYGKAFIKYAINK